MSRPLRALLLVLALALPPFTVAADPPAILLAEVYRNQVDVSQYLVSEKLDGVRAIWDGETLRFRSGKQINAPHWFVDGLPTTPARRRTVDRARHIRTALRHRSQGCSGRQPNGGRCAT